MLPFEKKKKVSSLLKFQNIFSLVYIQNITPTLLKFKGVDLSKNWGKSPYQE